MLHRLNVTWPCLSFDILKDGLGSDRQKFPHTSYWVAGTTAPTAKENEILVMKASSMHKTSKDGSEYHVSPSPHPLPYAPAMMLEAFGCMFLVRSFGSAWDDAENISLPNFFV